MTIKEILFQLQDDSGNITEDYNKERLTTNEASKQYYATLDNALSSIKKLIKEEVIGEDENSKVEEQYASPQPTVDEHYRNQLRQTQREILKQIVGHDEA